MPKDYTLDDYSKHNLPCYTLGGWNGEMPPYLKEAGVGPGMEVDEEVWERANQTSSGGGYNSSLCSDVYFFGLKQNQED